MKKPEAGRVLLLLLLGLALLPAEYYFILRAGLLNDRLVAYGLGRANRALLGRVEVGAVEGDPFRGLVIRDFRLRGPDGKIVATARETVADFSLLRLTRFQYPITVRISDAYFAAIKRDGRWNLTALRRPGKPGTGPPRNYPPIMVQAEIQNLLFLLSPSPERTIEARIPLVRGALRTVAREIRFSVTEMRAAVENPALGINSLTGEGMTRGIGGGWEVNLHNCRAVTASSIVDLGAGRYHTQSGAVTADFPRFEIAPDTLTLLWPNHILAIPVKGAGAVGGAISRVTFSFRIGSTAGDLNAVGFYSRPENLVDLKGDLFDFSLAEFLLRPVPLAEMTGGFTLSYRRNEDKPLLEQGLPTAHRLLKAHLELLTFSYPGVNSFPGTAEIEINDADYAAGIFSEFPGADFAAYASGKTDAPYPLQVRALLRNLNPRCLRSSFPEGRLAGRLQLDGEGRSFESFRGQGRLDLDPSTISGATVQQARLRFGLNRGRLSFSEAEIHGEGLDLAGTGWVEPVNRELPFFFDLQASARDGNLVAAWTGGALEVTGAAVKGQVSGNRSAWRVVGSGRAERMKARQVEAAPAAIELDLAGRAGRVSGRCTFNGGAVNIPAAALRGFRVPPLTLVLSAEMPPSPISRPTIDFRLDSTSPAKDYALAGAGRLLAAAAGDFRLDLAALDLTVMGRDWKLANPARARVERGEFWIDGFKLGNGPERIALDGHARAGDLNLVLAVEAVDLTPWATVFLPGDTVAGSLSGSLVLTGSAADPRLAGALGVERPVFREATLDRLAGTLGYAAGRMEFSLQGDAPSYGRMTAEGFVPMRIGISPGAAELRRQEPMRVAVVANEVNADVLTLLLPWIVNVGGRLSVDARLEGTLAASSWNGKAELAQVKFEVPKWGLALDRVSGRAEIADNRVKIRGLTAASGTGTAAITGGLELAGLRVKDMDLAIEAENFNALNTLDLRAVVDAKLALRGGFEFPRLSGNVQFTELTYRPPLLLQYQNSSWEREDPSIRVKGEEGKAQGSSPWLDRADLNLSFKIPETGLIRNSELNVPFGGNLTLKKPPGGFFLLFGRVEAKEGWLLFQGKPFRVERGNFVFPAIPAIDPSLDILASYRAGAYTTYVKMGGTLSVPTLDVYSDPPLDQADVLAVILFGRPVSELATGQRESLAAAGGQLVAGYAAQGLSKSLSDVLHIDAVLISPGTSLQDSGVGFGTYINSRLYLFYYHQFGAEAAEEFRLRYDVRKNLYVEAGQDRTGQGGADVFFSYPY